MKRLLALLALLPALTLAQSPPTGTQVYIPDNSTSGTLGALNAEVGPLQMSGEVGAALLIPASSTLVATLTPYCSADNSTWTSTVFYPDATGSTVPTLTTGSGTAYQYGVALLSACKYTKVRATSYTSGSASAVLTANQVAVIGNTVSLNTSDTVQSGCVLNAANATCQISTTGKSSFGLVVTAVASPTGITLVTETSRDGTNWDAHLFFDPDSGNTLMSVPNASLAVGFTKSLGVGAGVRYIRVRASTWTSGSATVQVVGTDTSAMPLPATVLYESRGPTNQPLAGTEGSVRSGISSLDGRQFVALGGPVQFLCSLNGVAATLTQCQAAPAAGLSLYVSWVFAQSTTTTAGTFALQSGTGTNCGTGTAAVLPASGTANRYGYPASSTSATTLWFPVPIKLSAAAALCAIGVATNTLRIDVGGFIAP